MIDAKPANKKDFGKHASHSISQPSFIEHDERQMGQEAMKINFITGKDKLINFGDNFALQKPSVWQANMETFQKNLLSGFEVCFQK